MLLLYHIQEQRAEITAQNLHSTMLLLYRGRRFTRRCRKLEFTFHYASTLSTLRQLEAIASAHLHSTMLLLYLNLHLLTPSISTYLHSTMLLLYRLPTAADRWRRPIYIPLCFYFIDLINGGINGTIKFTFHYASTLSLQVLRAESLLRYLHSTMLLLYLIFLFKTGHIKFIYIPLCFYFIPEHDACYFFSDLFTFHYASTLSRRLAERRSEQCINLHSTMLLLYQKWDWQKLRKTQIYIPLCFYFILPVMHPTVCRKVIYIPLCFYFIDYENTVHHHKIRIYIPLCFYFI